MDRRKRKNLFICITALTLCLACFNNCSSDFKAATYQTDLGLADSAIACNPSIPPVTDTELRLTGKQFQNTIRTLVNAGADTAALNTFYQTAPMVTLLKSFPQEGAYDKGNSMIYDTQDQRALSTLIQAQTSLAFNLAQWLIADAARLSRFVNYYGGSACSGTIPNKGASKDCYDAFIKGFGLRALRRPVETTNSPLDAGSSDPAAANDLAFYENIYSDAGNGGFDSLFTAMMLSPDSLFFNHFKGNANGGQVALTNYELAAKLSYYFTDNTPDDSLMAAAQSGFQGAGKTLTEQVDRLFASPGARARLGGFYRQWLRPDAIPNLTNSSNAPPGVYLYGLRQNAIQEVVDLGEYVTFGMPNGKLSDIINSDISFAKTSDLAGLYGVGVWAGKNADGSYDPAKLIHFPADQPRVGIFTRAAFAFSGARDNNLIIRGARIRKDFMCENLSPPAAFVLSPDITMQGPPTVRNIVEANTEAKGTSCAACHQPYINPLGNALENYDSFGRYRTVEPYFNADGSLKGTAPVNATSTPFASAGDQTIINDARSFSQALGDRIEINSCFVRHYFRFSQARNENNAADACKLNRMLAALINDPKNGSIQAMVKSVATDPSFQLRNINP